IEVKSLLIDILTAQRQLFPDVRWTTFRYEYLRSTGQYDDNENLFSGDDYTPDVMTSEVKTALQALDSHHLKEFFFFDDAKDAYRCPHCLEGRSQSDDEREFVQFIGPDSMQCIVCLSNYSVADCPSSNALGQSELYWKGGSGSLGLEFRRLSTGVAIVAV